MPAPPMARFSPAARGLVVSASLCVVIAGLRAAEAIVIPLLFSLFLAILLAPALGALRSRGVPTVLAYLLVAAGVLVVGLAVIAAVGYSLTDFLGRLPDYAERLDRLKADWLERLRHLGWEPSEQARSQYLGPGALMPLMRSLASGLASFFTTGFLILITTIFLLAESAAFPDKVRALPGQGQVLLDDVARIVVGVRGYMAIKTWVSLWTGLLIAGWLFLLGVRYPALWGLLTFALNYVPNFGPILASIPVIAVALLDLGPGIAGLVILGFLAVNLVFGYVIEPRWMGRGLGLSPLVVLLSLVFWGWVFGPPGMLLSVPLTMVVKIALESRPETQGLATLMGEAPPPSNSASTALPQGSSVKPINGPEVPEL